MKSYESLCFAMFGVVVLMTVEPLPAWAIDNPLTARLVGSTSMLREARATIFGAGSSVLVTVTRTRSVPDGATVTLNVGNCRRPGAVVFMLSAFETYESLTQLPHPLAEVARRAHSVIIHQTGTASSPAFACGDIVD